MNRFVGWQCPACLRVEAGRMPAEFWCGGLIPPSWHPGGNEDPPVHRAVKMTQLWVDNRTGQLG